MLYGDSLVTTLFTSDIEKSVVVTTPGGEKNILFEGEVGRYEKFAGGVLAFGSSASDGDGAWFINGLDDDNIKAKKITSSNIDYISNDNFISFGEGEEEFLYVERGEVDELMKFSARSLESEVIFEGDIHQFKKFGDDVIFISDQDGGLYVHEELDGEYRTRMIDDYKGGRVELVGSSLLGDVSELMV